jgi:hypothetical protein
MTVKDFPVRVTKKGKTRGRPSKAELGMSELMSWIINEPKYQEKVRQGIADYLLGGIK